MRQRGCGTFQAGQQTRHRVSNHLTTRTSLESGTRDGDSPVGDGGVALGRHPSTLGHEEPWGKLGGPPSKAKYSWPPIVHQYREGKVKSTPVRGVKENLKPAVHKQSESDPEATREGRRRAFCRMNRRVTLAGQVKSGRDEAAGKPSPNRARPEAIRDRSAGVDPKPGDLPMARVKLG